MPPGACEIHSLGPHPRGIESEPVFPTTDGQLTHRHVKVSEARIPGTEVELLVGWGWGKTEEVFSEGSDLVGFLVDA